MSPSLGPIPEKLQAMIEHWIADARLNDPDKLHENRSLYISGGPAWCNSISPDGTIWIDDYSDKGATVLTDERARIKTIVIAGENKPELLAWLPERTKSAIDCKICGASGWTSFSNQVFVCDTCSGLGWLLPR